MELNKNQLDEYLGRLNISMSSSSFSGSLWEGIVLRPYLLVVGTKTVTQSLRTARTSTDHTKCRLRKCFPFNWLRTSIDVYLFSPSETEKPSLIYRDPSSLPIPRRSILPLRSYVTGADLERGHDTGLRVWTPPWHVRVHTSPEIWST